VREPVPPVGAQPAPTARAGSAGRGAAREFWPPLLAIVAAGVLIRALYTLLAAPWPPPALDDQFYFSALPKLLAHGHGFVAPFHYYFRGGSLPTAEHPPLYPIVLAGLAKLGGTSPDAQRLAGSAFGAGTIATLGVLGRRLAGRRAGLMAAGLAAVYPVLVAADGALMSESLFGLLVALSLLAAYRLLETPSVGRAVALGVIAGLAALTRAEALLLLPLVLVPVLRRPAGLRAALVAILALAAVLTPWTIRNWITFDRPVVIATNSGSAVGGANCRQTYYGDQLGGWRPQCLHDHPGNEAERMATLRADGVRYARGHAGRLPVVLAVRLARVWNLFDPLQVPEGRSAGAEKLGVLAFFLLVALGVVGALSLRRQRGPLWILLAPFVVVSVTVLVTYGNQRFREAADVSLVVLAAVGLDALLRGRRPARAKP
jgi:4-amino-4-deoxy-L-arabinose transferase-like glycosyltransferase